MQYRIAWKHKTTDHAGHGEYCLSYDDAMEFAATMNRAHPEYMHWIEQDQGE